VSNLGVSSVDPGRQPCLFAKIPAASRTVAVSSREMTLRFMQSLIFIQTPDKDFFAKEITLHLL
jgi:hypothetical protein